MRSTRKEVTSKVHEHILECVEDYDDFGYKTPKEAAEHLYDEFKTVFDNVHEIKHTPNEASRFKKYIDGGAFNFLFYTEDMRNWIISLGIAQKRKYSNRDVEKYYAWLIYRETLKLIIK